MSLNALREVLSTLPEEDKVDYLLDYVRYLIPDVEPAGLLSTECGLHVTSTEGRYIHALSTPLGRIVSAEGLLRIIHIESRSHIDIRTVTSHIKRLRKKIKDTGLSIETHYNVGYQLHNDGRFKFPWNSVGEMPRTLFSPELLLAGLDATPSTLELVRAELRNIAA